MAPVFSHLLQNGVGFTPDLALNWPRSKPQRSEGWVGQWVWLVGSRIKGAVRYTKWPRIFKKSWSQTVAWSVNLYFEKNGMIISNPFQKNSDSIEKKATFPEYDFQDIEQNWTKLSWAEVRCGRWRVRWKNMVYKSYEAVFWTLFQPMLNSNSGGFLSSSKSGFQLLLLLVSERVHFRKLTNAP